ncbi:SETMR methyltransferase, partial [Acromyrmex insinuator]
LKMSEISEEIRYVMLFYYKKSKNAAQTCRQICEVYGADVVSERRTQRGLFSLMTRQKLSELGWEVLMHPPYSPDLAPSDYICFDLCRTLLMERHWPTKELPKIT